MEKGRDGDEDELVDEDLGRIFGRCSLYGHWIWDYDDENDAKNVVQSIQSIDRSSKGVAAESQSVSAATEEQSASMEEITSSSHSMVEMAEKLQLIVGKFKI